MSGRVAMPVCCAALIALAACEGDSEHARRVPAAQQVSGSLVGRVHINPGTVQAVPSGFSSPYSGDPTAISEGERYYKWFNCHGCHGSSGGGGMGPPLRDSKWVYGSDDVSIFESVMEGRPNGMPTWLGKIPDDQAWKIVAFIKSLGPSTSATDAQVVQESGQQEGVQ